MKIAKGRGKGIQIGFYIEEEKAYLAAPPEE